ncbi:MAG: carbon monoxide dehydrogenase subunit G [Pseudomonadota bacterium]
MEMNNSELIAASRETVWAALNDPEILKQAIPGCEELTMDTPTELSAVVKIKIGPVKATFKGDVELTDLNPPENYRISGSGKGGVAGFASGHADVRLEEVPEGTMLHYDVKADVGGKLAQLGSRLIDSTAKKLAGQFFSNFSQIVAPTEEDEAEADA